MKDGNVLFGIFWGKIYICNLNCMMLSVKLLYRVPGVEPPKVVYVQSEVLTSL